MAEVSKRDRELLEQLYEMEVYKALKRLMDIERHNIATKLLSVPATDTALIAKMQGQAEALKTLNLLVKKLYKDK